MHNRGFLIIDILLALALGAVLVAIISESSISTHETFWRAYDRSRVLDMYDQGRFISTSQSYGNDLVQTDMSDASGTINFTKISAKQERTLSDVAGQALCSVDFEHNAVVGSYGFTLSSSTPDMPASIRSISLPINPLLPLTDLQVRDGIAYVSADSSTASDPDVLLFDISDPGHATMLASLNTGPGISALAIAGKHIYAAAASTAAQLHIISMDHLHTLTLESTFQIPLPYATATLPLATSITYDKGRIYLGTEKWDREEFNVIDVSDSSNPAKLGGFEIGSKVNSILIRGNNAYVASASANAQLLALDIQNAAHPVTLSSFSPSGSNRQEAMVVSGFENSLDLGRTSGGYNVVLDHEAFRWASTSLPLALGYVSTDIPGGVYGIFSDRSRTYMATRQVNSEFRITDKTLSASTSRSYSLPILPQRMTCDGNKIYMLAHGVPFIYEISF